MSGTLTGAPTACPKVPAHRDPCDARGFSLMEAIVATVIAVIAALGLAYTFGIGRANINRFEAAREADAIAQSTMENLSLLADASPASESLAVGSHPDSPPTFSYQGHAIGSEYWHVDRAPVTVPYPIRGKLFRVTTVVTWTMGGFPDSVTYNRLMSRP